MNRIGKKTLFYFHAKKQRYSENHGTPWRDRLITLLFAVLFFRNHLILHIFSLTTSANFTHLFLVWFFIIIIWLWSSEIWAESDVVIVQQLTEDIGHIFRTQKTHTHVNVFPIYDCKLHQHVIGFLFYNFQLMLILDGRCKTMIFTHIFSGILNYPELPQEFIGFWLK